MNRKITALAIIAMGVMVALPAAAQRYGGRSYQPNYQYSYQPRTYYSPSRVYGSQNTYSAIGGGIGGAAAYYGSGRNAAVGYAGGTAGAIIGGQIYNGMGPSTSYYYPRAYGVQTTTPYMVRQGY